MGKICLSDSIITLGTAEDEPVCDDNGKNPDTWKRTCNRSLPISLKHYVTLSIAFLSLPKIHLKFGIFILSVVYLKAVL